METNSTFDYSSGHNNVDNLVSLLQRHLVIDSMANNSYGASKTCPPEEYKTTWQDLMDSGGGTDVLYYITMTNSVAAAARVKFCTINIGFTFSNFNTISAVKILAFSD